MSIELTSQQWADVQREGEAPVVVNDPSHTASFVLLRADLYERFRALFEDSPVTPEERQFHLRQFGRRAGWDDPGMDLYDDLDPRTKT